MHSNFEQAQQGLYKALKKRPDAHRSAQTFAKKIIAKDPTAIKALKQLSAKAGSDPKAANALRIIAVTIKYEKPLSTAMVLGGIPDASGKIIKVALSPVAWLISSGGKLFIWTGSQLQKFSHAI